MVKSIDYDKNLKIFAQRLIMLRKEKGLSQQEMADALRWPISTVWYYENCERESKLSNIKTLSQFFNETADYIMGLSDYRTLKKIAE